MSRLTHTSDRRKAILEVLAGARVRSQEELARILAERGFGTTQPMLSRDLRNLKVAKRDGAYQLLENERVTPLQHLSALLRGAQAAGPNMLLVHCEAGAAHAIARALEAEDYEGVIGTVAGDDTIFVAVTGEEAGTEVARRVRSLLEEE